MAKNRYRSGDIVVLHPRMLADLPKEPGQILLVLPHGEGPARYRVRFPSEKFERSIDEDAIDAVASSRRAKALEGALPVDGQMGWIDANARGARK